MLTRILGYFTLPLLLLLSNSSGNSAAPAPVKASSGGQTGTLEKMIVGSGSVAMNLDLNRLNGTSEAAASKRESLRFDVGPNSFFTVLVFDKVLRGPEQGTMGLIWGNSRALPEPLNASASQLIIEKLPSDAAFELALRDGKTGFVFFNIEGHLYEVRRRDARARHQERTASRFRGACEKNGTALGRRGGGWGNLNRHHDVSDRSDNAG